MASLILRRFSSNVRLYSAPNLKQLCPFSAKVPSCSRPVIIRSICASSHLNTKSTNHDLIFNRIDVHDFLIRLDERERSVLQTALNEMEEAETVIKQQEGRIPKPTSAQLRAVASHSAIPFIGFGFLDNFIMIVAGDYIDLTIGATLGITTMAAAALGNLVSDVAGIGSAWYVESMATKIGIRAPKLAAGQLEMTQTRWSSNIGRALGVSLGCLLGMIPLLFLKRKDKHEDKEKDKEKPEK